MQRTVIGLVILALLGGLAAAFGLLGRSPAGQPQAGNPGLAEPAEPANHVVKVPANSQPDEGGRSEAAPLASGANPSADACSVVVHAIHASTGAAVPQLPVLLWSGSESSDPWAANQKGCTDENGQARFHTVPGACEVTAATGGSVSGEARPGAVLELRLLVPAGYRICGTVQDRTGMPVPGAVAWLTQLGNLNRDLALATCDERGAFAIQDVSGPRLITARHADFAAAPQQYVNGKRGEQCQVRLVLQAEPGAVEGTVIDRTGAPVPGALVLIGTDRTGARMLETGAPVLLCSDEQGRFKSRGLQAGPNPVAARARGFGIWQGTVDVLAGHASELQIVLPASAVLTGTVLDGAGRPVPGSMLWTGVRNSFTSQCAIGSAQGSYRLEDLGTGLNQVSVWADNERNLTAPVEVRQGSNRWDPVLPGGAPAPSLRGRVIDHLGQPLPGCRVVAIDQGAQGRRQGSRTDNSGRFTLTDLWPGATMQVRAWRAGAAVSDFPDGVRNGIRLDGTELELRLPDPIAETGLLRLRAVDGAGRGRQVDVNLWHQEQSVWSAQRTAADGRFELRLYAGTLSIDVQSAEHPRVQLLQQVLPQGGVLDLGDITLLQGCGVFGRLRTSTGEVPAAANVRVLDGFNEAGAASYQSGSFRSAALKPGDYVLLVQAPGFAYVRVPVSLQAGEQREQDVQLELGTVRRLRVSVPADADAGGWVSVRVFDGSDHLRAWFNLPLEQSAGEGALWLTEGRYRLLATGARGWRSESELQVQDRSEVPPLQLTLQRR